MKNIGLIVGSLRKESFNRKIANEIIRQLPNEYSGEIIEIGNLPFYNEDIDNENPPKEYTDFRKNVASYDGIIFVTAEYNRGLPAVMKNAIDVGSRPIESNVWNGKPAGIVSSSTGAVGGFGANHMLRQSLVFVNMPTLQQPEMYLGMIRESFDEEGKMTERTSKYLNKFVVAYLAHLDKVVGEK